jgi:RHS repeat-associated protein
MSTNSTDLNTNDHVSEDPLLSLKEKIQSGAISEVERYELITEYVGRVLDENQGKELTYEDIRSQLLKDLGAGNAIFITGAVENFKNQKSQHNVEGPEASKQRAADPVMMYNGQFVHTAQDIKINGAGMDFVFTRTYKNQAYYNGPLGFNWDHNYNLWLRVEGNDIIVRSSGELREDRYRRHTIYSDYYVPPDGYHDIIKENGNSYVLRTPNGSRFIYEHAGPASNIHRIKRIEDRSGNYLLFDYDNDGKLHSIEVNNTYRKIDFHYDQQNRIDRIRAYEVSYRKKNETDVKISRIWSYAYDDFGDLISVTTPSTDRYPSGLRTYYEYSSAFFTGELMHNLLRIIDPAGQLYLENEFGIQKGLVSYNRVIRQRQGNGEYYFEYTNIVPDLTWNYSPEEMPSFLTVFHERNNHTIEHIYNKHGNLIVKREKILQDCNIKELVFRYRYNKDGVLVGSLSPEGTIVQNYYGREDCYKRHQGSKDIDPWNDQYLTAEERVRFGNLLAVVRRGTYYDILQMDLSRGVYGDFFPDIFSTSPMDNITKYTYETDYQQIASISDPRFTESADPRHGEVTNPDSDYNRHLILYEYYPISSTNQAKNLMRIKYPDTTFPDNAAGFDNIIQEYLEYDAKGRLKKVKNPEGSITEYQYFQEMSSYRTKAGYLQKEIHGAGDLNLTTEYEVNEAGQVIATRNPKGFLTRFIINELDQTVEVISSGPGFKTKNVYDENGLLDRRERDNISFDGVPSVAGPEVTTYRYDSQNNLTRETIGGLDLSKHHITRHYYDASDKKIKTISPEGNSLHYEYEERLLLKAVTRGACTSSASTTKTVYDGNSRKIRDIDGRGNITSFSYDPFDRLIATIDSTGNVRQNDYDKLGNIVTERFFEKNPDNKYYLLSRKTYDYDERGNKIHDILYLFKNAIHTLSLTDPDREFTDAMNQRLVTRVDTQYFYDENKRLFRTVNAKGQETTYEYDSIDRKITEKDNLGNYSIVTYDKNSNIQRIDRHEVIRDPLNGRIIRKEVFSTVNEYDKLDRKIASIDNLGNKTEFQYDSLNNLCVIKDALGNTKKYQYDVYNRKFLEINELTDTGLGDGANRLSDIVTEFVYNKENNIVLIKDSRGAETAYDYDPLKRLVCVTYYRDKSAREIQYDANDNIIFSKDNNGLVILYTFDALNRKVFVTLNKNTAVSPYPSYADDFEKYEYDGLGRPILQRNNFCEIKSKFDSLDRAYEEQIKFISTPYFSFPSKTHTLKRSFDILSNKTGIIYPSGREIEYNYDELNRITRISNRRKGRNYPGLETLPDNFEIAAYSYGGERLFTSNFGNHTGYQLSYDGLGRIISIKHFDHSQKVLLEIQHLFDGVGNKRLELNITTSSRKGEIYKYDSIYRLTKFEKKNIRPINTSDYKPPSSPLPVDQLDGQQVMNGTIGALEQNINDYVYKYDEVGNRIEEKKFNQTTINYFANLLNQYERRDAQIFQYDHNGNLIDDGIGRKYYYNYENQLARVHDETSNNDLINIAHDSNGRIIAVKEFGEMIYLINDGYNVIEEYNNENIIAQYLYENGIDNRCHISTESEEFWYHHNLTRSTRLLTDSKGRIPRGYRFEYDPFGTTKVTTTRRFNNYYLFGGKRFFSSVGLYDSRARSYSPELGRFIQRDPKGYIDELNLYAYGGNNPVIHIDTLGTEKTLADNNTTKVFDPSWLLTAPRTGASHSALKSSLIRVSYVNEAQNNASYFLRQLSEGMDPESTKRAAYQAREWLRIETRERLDPWARKLSEKIEKPKSLESLNAKYATPEEFIKATGRTRASINTMSKIIGGASVIFHPMVEGVGTILWEAFTDDPDRFGTFVSEPLFHPYANAERERRFDAFARENGFPSYEVMISIQAFKAGCKDCLETYGYDLSHVSARDLAKGSFIYDPVKAKNFMDKQLSGRGPAYSTIGPAPSH